MKAQSRFLRKTVTLVMVFFFFSAFVLALSLPAIAANPVVKNTCANQTSGAATVTCILTPFAIGDVLYVGVGKASAASGACSTLSSVTDTAGDSFTPISGNCYNSFSSVQAGQITILTAIASSTAQQTFTATWSAGCNDGFAGCGIIVIDVQNGITGAANVETTTGGSSGFVCGGGCVFQQTNVISFGTPSFLFEFGQRFSGSGAATAGTGFTAVPTASNTWLVEYNVGDGKVASPTAFPWTDPSAGTFGPQAIAIVFSSVSISTGSQTQTLGSCPTKNTGTFTMVNSTIYMYYGNALGSEVINTISTAVASITGSGSHTLRLLVYVSAGQSASVSNPLVLAYQQAFVISSGTTNNIITAQVNIPLNTAVANPLPFNLWGVGIVGDNKIVLNQSSFSGLFTQTGSPSTGNQPQSFTSQGASVGTKLYLCATGSYQSSLPAMTTTTTQSASTTTTASTTVTSTINTIGSQLFSTASNWPVIFLILLLPAGLFLGVTKNIAGALLGLMIGAIMGTLMGILPGWAFIGIVIALAAIAFISRDRG